MTRAAGFTLLELMVTMAIGAILLGLALPQMSRFGLAAARAKGATELYAGLNQARSEAIARNAPVTVCRRDWYAGGDFPQCAAAGGSWSQGWIVYQDRDGDFSGGEPDGAADIVSAFDPVGIVKPTPGDDAFAVVSTLDSGTHLIFQPNGRAEQRVQFTLCERSGRLRDARLVDVALSGRVSLVPLDPDSVPAGCGS